MKCRVLVALAGCVVACSGPAVDAGTGGGSSGPTSSASTRGESESSSPTSSSSGAGPAEGSASSASNSTTSTSADDTGSSSTAEMLDGPGCGVPPPCDRGVFEGAMRIESSDQIPDIAGYTEIRGGLEILSSDLECLDFLGCLQEVGRDIRIFGNPGLRSTDGLGEVARVGVLTADESASDREGSIIISENPGLETLGGFVRITELERLLVVSDNESLRSITGFTSLEVAAELVVRFNPALESLVGLYELLALADECQITNNGALCLSEAFEVCGDLRQQPGGGNTQNNRDDC